jgi:hypothetical protein
MQVNNSYLSGVQVGQPQAAAPSETLPASGGATPVVNDSSTHVASAELTKLLALVASEPDIRPEVVQRAAERLANGDYQTQDAAEQTAQAILNSPE